MKTLKNLFLVLLVVSISSCDLGDDKELDYGNGPYVAQFPFASKTAFFLKDDAATFDYTLPVELVGGNGLALSKDITITYEVDTVTTWDDDENPLTPEVVVNTAEEGLNFDFAGSASIVIPAGSTFASIPLKIYSGTLDDQDPPVLLLKLTSITADGVNVVTSGSKGSIALTLQGTCISNLSGLYNTYITRTSTPLGGPYTVASEPITEIGAGTYLTTVTGRFALPTITQVITGAFNQLNSGPTGGYIFKEVCGRIAVEQQRLFSVYSTTISQTPTQYANSSVNSATGVMTVYFQLDSSPAQVYKSVYTPVP